MDHIDPEDKTSYATKYKEEFLKYVENEYCAKHRCLQVIEPRNIPSNYHFPSTMASISGHSGDDYYDMFIDNEEYLPPKCIAEMTPDQSHHAACLLIFAMLYWNSQPELPHNWEQINPKLNDFLPNFMESCSTLWDTG